jgi:hypothetical protein
MLATPTYSGEERLMTVWFSNLRGRTHMEYDDD